MAEQKRIPCPGCATRKRLSIDNERWRSCEMCGSVRDGTIPDRRAPSAAEDALRAEVERLKSKRICACGATVEELVIGEVTYRTNASSTNAKLMGEVAEKTREAAIAVDMVETANRQAKALQADNNALKDMLRKYTGPLTRFQKHDVLCALGDVEAVTIDGITKIDAAIRARRQP